MKPKRFLPFLLLRSKASARVRVRSFAFSLLRTTFCLLFPACCLLLLTSCKDVGVPPDRIIIDTTGHGPDTTSHNFIWQIDTLGDGNSSILNDVFIIDENNIWAVGEIYKKDSVGQWIYPAYNVARWNGSTWSLQKVTVQFQGSPITVPLTGIFAFSATDIWLMGGLPIHGDGNAWTLYDIRVYTQSPDLDAFRGWGTSSTNMFFVGMIGNISHYDGVNWQKIESGTTLDVLNIYGGSVAGQTEVLAVASGGLERKILSISGSATTELSDIGVIQEPLRGVWFAPMKKYFVVGSGIYRKNRLEDSTWMGAPLELTDYFSTDICGVDTNDVFVVGAFGDLLHYNGSTWKQYPELRISGSFFGVSSFGNTVAVAGYHGNRAIAVIGRRQQ